MAWIWAIQFLSPFCHQTELCDPSFKETPLSGLPFSCLFLWVGIRLALHPLPRGVEGFLRHNPRLQFWKVASDHRTTQCESGQSNAFCLPQHTCFFVVSFPFLKKTYLHSLNQIQTTSLWVWVSVWMCVSSISLISTWACCLHLKRSGSENKQSSSYLAWAGKVDSAEQASRGVRGGRVQDWTQMASTWTSRELNQTP